MPCYTWNRSLIVLPHPCAGSIAGTCSETATWFWVFAGVLSAVLLARAVK